MAVAPAGWWRGPAVRSVRVVSLRSQVLLRGVRGGLAGEDFLQGAVFCGVVAGAVLPAAPDDQHPGAGGDADGVRVVLAAVAGGGVDGGGPGAGVPGSVGEVADRVAELAGDVPAELVAGGGARPAGGGRGARPAGPGAGGGGGGAGGGR